MPVSIPEAQGEARLEMLLICYCDIVFLFRFLIVFRVYFKMHIIRRQQPKNWLVASHIDP